MAGYRRPGQRAADADPTLQYLGEWVSWPDGSRSYEYQIGRNGQPVLSPWAFDNQKHKAWQKARAVNQQAIQAMIREGIETLVRVGVEAMAAQVDGLDFAQTMQEMEPILQTKFDKMMKEEAAAVRDSIDRSFRMLITARERAPHYREGQNRLPYAMRRAIMSDEFVTTQNGEMLIGNRKLLDREARHWHRLAFGAGQAAGDIGGGSYDVSIGGSYSTMEMVEGPSPGFYMPPGIWVGPGQSQMGSYDGSKSAPLGVGGNKKGVYKSGPDVGFSRARRQFYSASAPDQRKLKTSSGDEFYPTSTHGWGGPRWIRTKGIVGRNFFAAGLARLAEDLPNAIEQAVAQAFEEWASAHAENGGESISV